MTEAGESDSGSGWPFPESDDHGRYLEDTITIDWQTPSVLDKARALLEGMDSPEERVDRLFRFVRDEIEHSFDSLANGAGAGGHPGRDHASRPTPCRASEVLREATGFCYAKSHLLAALLRIAGFPTGFCYARLLRAPAGSASRAAADPAARSGPGSETAPQFVLHGFNATYWKPTRSWIFLDARGDRPATDEARAIASSCRFEPPWHLAFELDLAQGESFLPFIYHRPAKRIVDLLERAPSFEAVVRHLPGSID